MHDTCRLVFIETKRTLSYHIHKRQKQTKMMCIAIIILHRDVVCSSTSEKYKSSSGVDTNSTTLPLHQHFFFIFVVSLLKNLSQ